MQCSPPWWWRSRSPLVLFPSGMSVLSLLYICKWSPPALKLSYHVKKGKGGKKKERKGKKESLLHPGTSCLNENPPICPQQDRQREGRSCRAAEERERGREGWGRRGYRSDPSAWRPLISLSWGSLLTLLIETGTGIKEWNLLPASFTSKNSEGVEERGGREICVSA